MKSRLILILYFSFFSLASLGHAYDLELQDVSLGYALRLLAENHNKRTSRDDGGVVNVFVSADVDFEAKINMSLKNVSTFRALHMVSAQANCRAVVKGNYVFIVQGRLGSKPKLPELKVVYD